MNNVNGLILVALAINLAVVGVFDAYLVAVYGPADTITSLVHRLSKDYPAIPLGAGMLIGHLFL